jgi:hypothetical protein
MITAASRVVERLDFFLEGLIELRIHPGAAADATGFLYRNVFELDGWWVLGHRESSVYSQDIGIKKRPRRYGPGLE